MINDTTIKDRLKRVGLNETPARIYLFLLGKGEARIQEIVQATKIPRSTVYESLKDLYGHGLAEEIIDGSYKRIRPYSIVSMKHGLNEKIHELKKTESELNKLEKMLDVIKNPSSLDSTTVRYYKGVAGARQLFWNSLKAKDTVYVYSEYGRPKYVGEKFYADFAQASRERNIQEKVLININPRVRGLLGTYLGSPNVRTSAENMRIVNEKDIPIKGETLIYDNIYTQLYIYTGEINGFEIESVSFTETQRSIFEALWRTAKPLTSES